PLDIKISSIEKERVTSKLEGSHRKIDYGYTFNDREINLRLMLRYSDAGDYFLLKDEVYSMFHLSDKIFISELQQNGKRYFESIDDRYEPDNINKTSATIELSCTTVELPYDESIGTSADIDGANLIPYADLSNANNYSQWTAIGDTSFTSSSPVK